MLMKHAKARKTNFAVFLPPSAYVIPSLPTLQYSNTHGMLVKLEVKTKLHHKVAHEY